MLSTQKKGFTLIELLIVVVIIGILAAIAIPKFANTKEKAYIASMKADLRNLLTAQEAYISDSTMYGDFTGTSLQSSGALSGLYTPSAGVTVTATADAGRGWDATASHNGTDIECTIAVGSRAASPNRNEGEPVCAKP
jgi:type IV pilus assembly protein PilA